MAGLRLDVERHAEAALARAFFTVREASVGALRLDLPTWRAPLVLRASRIRLVLQQRNMPEVSRWRFSVLGCPRGFEDIRLAWRHPGTACLARLPGRLRILQWSTL